MVLNTSGEPVFLEKGTGGIFAKYDPNEPIETLKEKWIPEASVILINSTNQLLSDHNLVDAIKWFVAFGQGIGNYSLIGRQIWQIKHSKELLICWRSVREGDPAEIRNDLIEDFYDAYGAKPFANVNENEPINLFLSQKVPNLDAASFVSQWTH